MLELKVTHIVGSYFYHYNAFRSYISICILYIDVCVCVCVYAHTYTHMYT